MLVNIGLQIIVIVPFFRPFATVSKPMSSLDTGARSSDTGKDMVSGRVNVKGKDKGKGKKRRIVCDDDDEQVEDEDELEVSLLDHPSRDCLRQLFSFQQSVRRGHSRQLSTLLFASSSLFIGY